MGALFAVYWLARLDLPEVHGSSGMDGQRGFCFGVDQQWAPPTDAEVQAIARKLSHVLMPETLAQKQATSLLPYCSAVTHCAMHIVAAR
eukprot:scaffold79527_cov54-Phaeocystis_antarctica.AAC.3